MNTKSSWKSLIALLILSIIAPPLQAANFIAAGNPAFEPFSDATGSGGTSYTTGSTLAGQTNAQGLPWFEAGPGATEPSLVSGALTYSGLRAVSGNSVTYGGATSGGNYSRWNLNSTFSGSTAQTVYYSVLFEIPNLANLPSSGVFVMGFNSGTGASGSVPTTIGARLYVRTTSGGYNLGINKADGTAADIAWEPTVYTTNTTYFVVAAYTFSGTVSAASDSVSLWVDPSSSSFNTTNVPTADVTTSAGSNMGSTASADSIASFLLRFNTSTEPVVTIDELSVGLTWADVTPTPPTATITPSFSGLTASPSTAYGTSVLLSGTLSGSGPTYPAMGETVFVSVNGKVQTTTITNSTGAFSINYNPGNAPISGTPYPITYSYAGDATLTGATNTSTSMTINGPLVVVLNGCRQYDGTAAVAAGVLYVSNAVAGDVVTVSSGTAALAATNAGAEAITNLGTLTLGGGAAANYTLTGASGSVIITIPPVSAGHPDFEPFNYSNFFGNLAGQTNAQGLIWYAAGSGGGGQPQIQSGTLTVPGLEADPGNSVTYGGASGITARLDLGTATNNSIFTGGNGTPVTLYYSMAFEVTVLGGLSSSPAFIAGFNNSTGAQTTQPTTVGARLYAELSGSGYTLGINKADGVNSDIAWEPYTFNVGTTYFVVAAYTFSGTPGADNDAVSLWVNPSSSTFGTATAPAPDASTSAGPNIGSTSVSDEASSFILREAVTTEPATMVVDELSIGTTWADVTPTGVSAFPIISESVSGSNLTLTWKSVPGVVYHVVGNSTPTTPVHTWSTVAGPITASATTTSAVIPMSGSASFYRVVSP